jgi:DNA-binding MarR family transcriptional regulator
MARRTSPRSVQAEIGQRRPFRSRAQEATIALLRTASVVHRALERVVLPAGLTLAQYNALRIIRGAEPEGVASLTIRDRMIEQGTTITRILDRLERTGLIERRRGRDDRRLVLCHLTRKGRALLESLDAQIDAADRQVVGGLSSTALASFIELLDRVRAENAGRGAPRCRPGPGAPR